MKEEELLELCEKAKVKLTKSMVSAICNYPKDFLEMEVDDWLNIFKKFKMQSARIGQVRGSVFRIYEHLINSGETVYNPFYKPQLSTESISAQNSVDLYVSQDQLTHAVNNLSDGLVGGCIAQLIYEGVKSFNDIFYLCMDDIDFEKSIINLDGYTVNMSHKLCEYVKDYVENDVYVTRHSRDASKERTFKMQKVRENGFAKMIMYSGGVPSDDKEKSFANSCTQIFMKLGFTNSQVYNSGLLNFILKKCDYSLEKFKALFNDTEKNVSGLLDDYAREYGVDRAGMRYYLKGHYQSYMIKNAPFE